MISKISTVNSENQKTNYQAFKGSIQAAVESKLTNKINFHTAPKFDEIILTDLLKVKPEDIAEGHRGSRGSVDLTTKAGKNVVVTDDYYISTTEKNKIWTLSDLFEPVSENMKKLIDQVNKHLEDVARKSGIKRNGEY